MSNREPRWRGVGRARTSGAQVIDRVKVLREIAGIILGWTAPALSPNYLNSLKTPKLFANIAALFANKRELLAKNLALSIDKKQWLANKAALSANKRKLLAKNLALSTDKKQLFANHAALFANKGKLLAKNLALSTNKKQLLANQAALFINNTRQWVEWARRAGRLELKSVLIRLIRSIRVPSRLVGMALVAGWNGSDGLKRIFNAIQANSPPFPNIMLVFFHPSQAQTYYFCGS